MMKLRLPALPRVNWRVAAMALITLSILHILTTLATPAVTTTTAYARLRQMPVNTMQILPPISPENQPIPFLGPDARYAVCRFDAGRAPVALKASLLGKGWTLALYSITGDNFYVAAGSEGKRTDMSLLLVTSDERFTGLSPEAKGQISERQTSVPVATPQGLAVIRAPDTGVSYQARNEVLLKSTSCTEQR